MNKRTKTELFQGKIKELEHIIHYQFKNVSEIKEALTHSSYANEHRAQHMKDNERLEFLGDAILDLIISKYLFHKYLEMPEGDLSKIRASIVCEASLAKVARKMKLGSYIRLGKGEEMTGGRQRASILADTFEAVTGAIFVDGGYEVVEAFLRRTLIEDIDHLPPEDLYTDYKTLLQESVQKESTMPLHYDVVGEKGPDHDKKFYVEVYHGEKMLGQGEGKSKKEAEQHAAKIAIRQMKKE